MNSLVVLFSVMALAAAEPSVPFAGVLHYASPAVAIAPAAVSHQSRVDIKSSPAIVASEIVAPVTRTVVANPALVAPASYVAPLAYSAPLNFAAPIAIAPAAVSTQSRVDIKSSPAIVNTYATAPFLQPVATAPLAAAHLVSPLAFRAPIAYPSILNAAPFVPLASTYEKKAVEETPVAPVEGSAPIAPSETPEVAAARAVHLEAKAFEEAHQIQKRSVLLGAPVISPYTAPIVHRYAASPIVYTAPAGRIAVAAPYYRYY